MLRITIIHDRPGKIRVHLEGRLAGPWVQEAEHCWQTACPALRDKAVIVDLRDVDFVDSAGEKLLAAMHQRGVRFLAVSAMMRHLVAEITGQPEETADPGAYRLV